MWVITSGDISFHKSLNLSWYFSVISGMHMPLIGNLLLFPPPRDVTIKLYEAEYSSNF